MLTKLVICIATLVMEICFARLIIKNPKQDEWNLVEASIDILESCYTDRFSTVGLAGPSIESFMKKLSSRDTIIPITLIDNTSRPESHELGDRGSRYKLQVFVITVTNLNTLVETVTQVKNSKWWNHMASFLFICWPKNGNGCSDAYTILWEAWKMNLINSKFVCLHRARGRLIYTCNPYTSKAPAPWLKETTHKGINNHIWTLFVREYREGKSRCGGLDFDKTLDLGGYEIRASIKGMEKWWYEDADKKPTLINRVNNITAQFLMSSLNATWKLLLEPANDRALIDQKTGQINGIAANTSGGINDIHINIVAQHMLRDYETTYPHYETTLAILTQYRGYKSQLNKIISVLDKSSRFGVLVVFIITFLVFKCYLRKPLIPAILELVLIMLNAGIRKIPEKLAPRMYLGALFIFLVTIHGIYQGKFASLLTKEVRLPDIDSIGDLARSDHTIYGLGIYRTFFNRSAFKGRFVEISEHNCTGHVLRDSKAACVDTTMRLTGEAAKFRLYMSRKSTGTIYGVYLIRPDWPLEERINVIFGRAAAGAIVKKLYSKESDSEIDAVKSYENQDQEPTVKVLAVRHIGFALGFLGIGLGCAAIIFTVEVATFEKAIANLRIRIRRRIILR